MWNKHMKNKMKSKNIIPILYTVEHSLAILKEEFDLAGVYIFIYLKSD